MDIAAFEVSDLGDHAPAGAYEFVEDGNGGIAGINHGCPCGCGAQGYLALSGPKAWAVEGEWPKVTLSPSIGFWGQNKPDQGFHWHGWLIDGVFTTERTK